MQDVVYEWKGKNGFNFLPLEAGVLVITLDNSQLADLITQKIFIYVSYAVKSETDTSRLSINIADLTLTSQSWYRNDLGIMEWKEQIFINLLTLKSTSEYGSFIIHTRNDTEKFIDFLFELNMEVIKQSYRLNFCNYDFLTTQTNSNITYHHFFGCSMGYFNGVFIRFKYIKYNIIKAKIYTRYVIYVIFKK